MMDYDPGFDLEPEPEYLYEILVPCNWNCGTPIRTRHHKEWDKRVRRITQGLTILKPALGQWINEGELYKDRVIPVRLKCTIGQMEAIAKITIAHYEQEAVMFYKVSDHVKIVHATEQMKKSFVGKRNNFAS